MEGAGGLRPRGPSPRMHEKGGTMPKRPAGFKDISTTHLECRSWLHAWDFRESEVRKGGILVLKLICMRCKTYRYDQVDRFTGELLRRQYVHAEGYNIDQLPSWGGRKEFNWNVRRELISRLDKER